MNERRAGYPEEELADSAAMGADMLRSLANRWLCESIVAELRQSEPGREPGRDIDVAIAPEERDVLTSYRLGASSCTRKPTDFDEFLPVLDQLVRYWLALNQPPPAEVQS